MLVFGLSCLAFGLWSPPPRCVIDCVRLCRVDWKRSLSLSLSLHDRLFALLGFIGLHCCLLCWALFASLIAALCIADRCTVPCAWCIADRCTLHRWSLQLLIYSKLVIWFLVLLSQGSRRPLVACLGFLWSRQHAVCHSCASNPLILCQLLVINSLLWQVQWYSMQCSLWFTVPVIGHHTFAVAGTNVT